MVFHIKIAADKKEEDREKETHLMVRQSRPSLDLIPLVGIKVFFDRAVKISISRIRVYLKEEIRRCKLLVVLMKLKLVEESNS